MVNQDIVDRAPHDAVSEIGWKDQHGKGGALFPKANSGNQEKSDS
jgi:hypothetical protein